MQLEADEAAELVFTARLEGRLHFGEPQEVSAETPALREAAAALGMLLGL